MVPLHRATAQLRLAQAGPYTGQDIGISHQDSDFTIATELYITAWVTSVLAMWTAPAAICIYLFLQVRWVALSASAMAWCAFWVDVVREMSRIVVIVLFSHSDECVAYTSSAD